LLRKPDPPVLVAITKEPPGRIKTTSIQVLDYNLHRCAVELLYDVHVCQLLFIYRFDIEDRKGLEIVMLTALLIFQDSSEEYHSTTPTTSSGMLGALRRTSVVPSIPIVSPHPRNETTVPPIPPPKPSPKTGVDRIAETHALRGDVNEITVEGEGSVTDYAQYCANLLQVTITAFFPLYSSHACLRMMRCCSSQ
jgi:hypothetical protein